MSQSWPEVELGDVLTLKRGYDLPNSDRREGQIPIVSSSGVTGYHNEAKVQGPGVITGRYGTLGEVFLVKEPYWPLNTTLYVQNFKGNDPAFISYFLKNLNLATQNTAGAVPGLNRNALHLLKVKVPPLPTQRKIAAILSAYDDLIENNTRRVQVLEQMARALYREWFVEYRFPGHEQAEFVEDAEGRRPQGWERVKFTETALVLSGGTPKTTEPSYWGGEIPFYSPKDSPNSFYVTHTEKNITALGLSKCNSRLYPKNTVFITARGTVGKLALAADDMAMNQSCYALDSRNELGQYFLFLLTEQLVEGLKKQATGAVFDAITVATFEKTTILKPPKQVLDDFSQQVKPLFEASLSFSRRNANLRRTRDLLLPRLVSGELDISNCDIKILQKVEG